MAGWWISTFGVGGLAQDENTLYNAMVRMLNDTEMHKSMAGNARKMIADRFEQGFVRKCLYDFYDEVLKND